MRPCSAHSCSRWCRASSAATSAPPTRRAGPQRGGPALGATPSRGAARTTSAAQHLGRLAQRSAPNGQPFAQGGLVEKTARRQRPREDLRTQPRGGGVVQGVGGRAHVESRQARRVKKAGNAIV